MGRDARPTLPLWAWGSTNEEPGGAEVANPDAAASRGRLADAAQRIRRQAIRYAARYLGDGLKGEEILEDVLRSAVGAVSRRGIEKPERYLFRGVVRRVRALLSRGPQTEFVGSVADLEALKDGCNAPRSFPAIFSRRFPAGFADSPPTLLVCSAGLESGAG